MASGEYTLKAESELRCTVGPNEPLSIKLIEGNAEIFGIEMAVAPKEYTFVDENIAVFTWYGAKLIVTTGSTNSVYKSEETPMVAYVNTHVQLEAKRDVALATGEDGPRVLIVGPNDHGKSTTSRILSAYATRLDRNPIYVDLDVGQGSVGIPGCIAAVPLEKTTISIEDGFALAPPLVHFYGHSTPQENIDLYKLLLNNLAKRVDARLSKDVDARASGLIVNTCGWIDGAGYELILHAIQALGIDVVLVMSHDKLHSSLSAALDERIAVIKLPRSGGVETRDTAARARHRKEKIREYFYGRKAISMVPGKPSSAPQYSPFSLILKISEVRILRAGGLQLSEGMRAIGEATTDNSALYRVTPTSELNNTVLAVLHPSEEEGEDEFTTIGTEVPSNVITSNVAGFLRVIQVDLESDTMRVLSPCQGKLPSPILLAGSIKFVDI